MIYYIFYIVEAIYLMHISFKINLGKLYSHRVHFDHFSGCPAVAMVGECICECTFVA